MTDELDDRIRAALGRAAGGYAPTPAPESALHAAVRHRRTRRALVGSAMAVAAAAVAVLAFALPGGNARPVRLLQPAAPGGRSSTTVTGDTAAPAPGAEASSSTCCPTPPSTTRSAGAGSSGTVVTVVPSTAVVPGSSTTSTPQTTSPPPPSGAVTVTEADSGKTVSLHVGQLLVVQLHGSSAFHYSAPQTSKPSVLAQLSSSADDSSGDANGQFRGEQAGQADVTSIGDPPCRHASTPCGQYSQAWRVTVNVVP